MQQKYYLLTIGILVGVILLLRGCGNKDVVYWKNLALKGDTAYVEGVGRYARRVVEVNTQRKLLKIAEEELGDAFDVIQANEEKIINLQTINAKFKDQHDTIIVHVNEGDTSQYRIALVYPNNEQPMVRYNGMFDLHYKTIFGLWTFEKIKLNLTLTETKDGGWKTRVIGPDYFEVDSIGIVGLPKEKINPPKLFTPIVGVGISKHLGRTPLQLYGGVKIREKFMVVGGVSSSSLVSIAVLKDL